MDDRKKNHLLCALEKGMVMIHLDARRPGVVVPHHLQSETHLRLNLSFRFDPPDLKVEEWGIQSTLSFLGERFKVAIPWPSVFAIVSHTTREFWIYEEDVPEECLAAIPKAGRNLVAVRCGPVEGESVATAKPASSESAGPESCRRFLRIVK